MTSSLPNPLCPVREMLTFLNQRHMPHIIYALMAAPRTFTDLQQSLAINTATLTKRIKDLHDKAVITKCSSPVDARVIYYSLTEKGQEISKTLTSFPALE